MKNKPTTGADRRLIEDYLPIEQISAAAARETPRKGLISTLHVWWARRPLAACRAAVYGALVPADQFAPANGPEDSKRSLARANAAKFLATLCQYPGPAAAIEEARRHVWEAHAARLSAASGHEVTAADVATGKAPRPKVLDMFAGGGAIPLEALRLGCEAYASDLNPVAHILELCTLVYPQKFGRPDEALDWRGLAAEVRHWGNWMVARAEAEVGANYPPIPDPEAGGKRKGQLDLEGGRAPAVLRPQAYLWTRTVVCKNPACGATVPLVRQTWLRKKKTGRLAALRAVAPRGSKRVRFELVEAGRPEDLGFDPAAFSSGGSAACFFCGAVADEAYVKAEGVGRRVGQQLMAVICARPGTKGKVYLAASGLRESQLPGATVLGSAADAPSEPISPLRPSPNARGLSGVTRHGLTSFADLFASRQLATLQALVAAARAAHSEMLRRGYEPERALAVATCIALVVDRVADRGCSLSRWDNSAGKVQSPLGMHSVPMVWDFAEANPFGGASGDARESVEWVAAVLEREANAGEPADVQRGSATKLAWPDSFFDAVITDPPYYDSVPYADISDFFYVWLKRTIGDLYPEHFAAELTPKAEEAVAHPARHGGLAGAKRRYEAVMAASLVEAARVLKPGATLVLVYAHRTTLGWSTLVNALREAGFEIEEAWPVETEMRARLRGMDSAALASSIFLVARKRTGREAAGSYESEVRPELEVIVRERVGDLWEQGISGADLVIACVGAGLRAFTRFPRVEYANGEEVPAERFLAEVEAVVLDAILGRLSRGSGGASLAGVDAATRFYVLWRYAYRAADLDAGDAIIFANGTHVELDGPSGLSTGPKALAQKLKSAYHLRGYAERGADEGLGKTGGSGEAAPAIDALHRILWLMENQPHGIAAFLRDTRADLEQLRLIAQVLAGPALKGGELAGVSPTGEMAALAKLMANWKTVVGEAEAAATPLLAGRQS